MPIKVAENNGSCTDKRKRLHLFFFAYRKHYLRIEFIESYSVKLGFCSTKIHSR